MLNEDRLRRSHNEVVGSAPIDQKVNDQEKPRMFYADVEPFNGFYGQIFGRRTKPNVVPLSNIW